MSWSSFPVWDEGIHKTNGKTLRALTLWNNPCRSPPQCPEGVSNHQRYSPGPQISLIFLQRFSTFPNWMVFRSKVTTSWNPWKVGPPKDLTRGDGRLLGAWSWNAELIWVGQAISSSTLFWWYLDIFFWIQHICDTHTHTQNSQCALKQVLSIILKQCTWWLWVTFGCCLERWRFCRDLHFQWNLQAGPVEKYTSGSQLMSLELVLGLEFGSHHHSLTACGTLSQCGKNWCTQGRMLSIQDVLDRFYCSMRGVCFQACGCQVLFPVHMSWTADEERRILMLDFGAFWILASRMQSLVF